jgi:cytochrome c oxidase assembly factor CtaG
MTTAPSWSSWTLDPLVLVLVVAAAVLYGDAYRRARGRAAVRRPNIGHWLPYYAGLVLFALALMSPLDAIGDRWLLSAHMFQHVLLADISPALIVLGLRAPLLPLGLTRKGLQLVAPRGPVGRVLNAVIRPLVVLPLWALATWFWSVPAVFDFAAAHSGVHALEHITLFYTGLALWRLVIDPLPSDRRNANGRRLAYLGFTRVATAFVCIPLTWAGSTFYSLYANAPRGYGLSPLADQQLAGASMCFLELLVFGIAFAVVFVDTLSQDAKRNELVDRLEAGA